MDKFIYFLGDKVEIIENNTFHNFEIGEVVEIIQVIDDNDDKDDKDIYYEAQSKNGQAWFVTDEEIKLKY